MLMQGYNVEAAVPFIAQAMRKAGIRAPEAEMELGSPVFPPTTRMDSGSRRTWISLVRTVKYRPAPISRIMST